MWWPLLVARVIKVLVMRYFGLRCYRAARPPFIGPIPGEFLVGSTVMITGLALGRRVYAFWPY